MNALTWNANHIFLPKGERLEMPFKVESAGLLDHKLVVLLDPDDNFPRIGSFHNLMALDFHGRILWKAELPTKENSDAFWRIKSFDPLIASSFCSYECRIDPDTGRIVEKRFYK